MDLHQNNIGNEGAISINNGFPNIRAPSKELIAACSTKAALKLLIDSCSIDEIEEVENNNPYRGEGDKFNIVITEEEEAAAAKIIKRRGNLLHYVTDKNMTAFRPETKQNVIEFIEFAIKKLKADIDNIIDSPRARTVRDIASTNHTDDKLREWASGVGTYFGRYRLKKAISPGVGYASIKKSPLSVVRFATDMTVPLAEANVNDLNSADNSGRYVAVKMIYSREQFEHERKMLLCKSRKYIGTNEDVEVSSNRF